MILVVISPNKMIRRSKLRSADAAPATYVSAAADKTFLVCPTSSSYMIPVLPRIRNALEDALNSTGSVTN